jgi:hypothetical protein
MLRERGRATHIGILARRRAVFGREQAFLRYLGTEDDSFQFGEAEEPVVEARAVSNDV